MVGSWRAWLERFRPDGHARRKPLILINGLAEQAETWFRNLSFWRRHFDVHMPNLLVYDGAALHRRLAEGLPISVEYLVDQLHLYLDQFAQSPPYDLISSSLGGKVAVEYAVRYPEEISRLVLICPSGLGDEERLPVLDGVRYSDQKALIDSVFHDPRQADPGLLRYYRAKFQSKRWRMGFLRTIRGTLDHSVRDRFAEVTQPVLLINGREDRIVDPKHAAEVARLLQNGQVLTIPQCGHAPQIEKPWLVNRLVVRFLTAAEPQRLPELRELVGRPSKVS